MRYTGKEVQKVPFSRSQDSKTPIQIEYAYLGSSILGGPLLTGNAIMGDNSWYKSPPFSVILRKKELHTCRRQKVMMKTERVRFFLPSAILTPRTPKRMPCCLGVDAKSRPFSSCLTEMPIAYYYGQYRLAQKLQKPKYF